MRRFKINALNFTNGRGATMVLILAAALLGFEIFNFDTTRFALLDLMSGHHFGGVEWATILAFAFCSIDFAGMVRMFTPEQSLKNESKEVWLLMGAWLLGATLNAVMTWYAIALTIAGRPVGASLVTYEEMLFYAPIFVAVLVWLTRILLIGASSVAADRLMNGTRSQTTRSNRVRRQSYHRDPVNNGESFQEDFFGE